MAPVASEVTQTAEQPAQRNVLRLSYGVTFEFDVRITGVFVADGATIVDFHDLDVEQRAEIYDIVDQFCASDIAKRYGVMSPQWVVTEPQDSRGALPVTQISSTVRLGHGHGLNRQAIVKALIEWFNAATTQFSVEYCPNAVERSRATARV